MIDMTGAAAPSSEDKGPVGPPDTRPSDADAQLAKLVRTRWKEGGDELAKPRRHFWQNMAFFLGEQWVWWDSTRSLLQALPQAWSPIGPGRARLTINRIEPNVTSVMARMMASDLAFEVTPNDASDDLIAAARLAERILTAEHHDQEWEAVRHDEMFGALMGGTSAVAVEWDPSAGDTLEVMADGRVVGTGAARLQALNVNEFCIEPGVRDYRTARWWVMGLTMSPKQAQQRYAMDWEPKPDASGLMSPMQHKILSDVGRPSGENMVLCLTMYERPNQRQPQGRQVIVVNDRIVAQSPWPFPFKTRLNLRPFRQKQITAQWQGWTYVNSAIGVQYHYNHARSVIAEHMKVAGNARLMAPYGAFSDEQFTNDAGSILWYSPDGTTAAPQYLNPPNLPRWLSAEADTLKAELDDLMYVHATSRGEASFDRASGQALALLAEKDDSPLGPMAREQAQGWSELAEMILQLYQAKALEPRRATIPGGGGLGVPVHVRWSGKDLKGQTQARVPLDATAPKSKAAQQSFADGLWDRKIVTDPQMYLRLAGVEVEDATEVLDADVARAQRENARMSQGIVELVSAFDDHAKHIAEHNRMRKGDSYLYSSKEIQSIFDDHVQMHSTQVGAEYGAQVRKAQVDPGLAKLPQGDEPIGSVVPPDWAEQQGMDPQTQAALAQMGPGMAGGGQAANPGLGAMAAQGGPMAAMGQNGMPPAGDDESMEPPPTAPPGAGAY